MAKFQILKRQIRNEDDLVLIRHSSKQIAEMLGFDQVDQIRIATAVSEIARNSLQYAVGGSVEFFISSEDFKQKLVIKIEDKGQGIEDLDLVLQGVKQSKQGLGLGITGAKSLVDNLDVHTEPGKGTEVILTKYLLPSKYLSDKQISDITTKLAKIPGENTYEELRHQNEELINILDLMNKQKASLEKANENLRKQALIFETISDAIVITDLNDKITDMNPAAEHMFGYTKDESIGKSPNELFRPQMSNDERNKVIKKVITGEVNSSELVFKNKNKEEGITLTVLAVLKDDKGEPTAILSASHDVTELIKSRQMAEQANKAKSEFLSSMSHELRTPMNAIIGISDLIITGKTDNLTPKQLEGIQLINRSGTRLLDLINDILDLAKVESGKLEVNNTVVSVSQMFSDIQNVVKNLIADKNIKFWVYRDVNVPDYVYTDGKKLSQILLNLLGNSAKFTEKGEIILKVYQEENKLYFEVQDTGIGIKKEDIGKLFKEFQQLDTSATKKYKGTGLGLTLSKRFIELLGGEISIESEPSVGTTVRLYIPLVALPDTTISDIKPGYTIDTVTKQPIKEKMPEGKKAKLLIAEDEEIGRKTIDMMLGEDYEIIFAENGQEAVDKFKSEHPDVVLMDIMMPVMSGYDAFKEIRKIDSERKIPIIALTATAMKGEREKIINFGFDEYISKPIDAKIIRDILNQYLEVGNK